MSILSFLKEDKHFESVAPKHETGLVFILATFGIGFFALVPYVASIMQEAEVVQPVAVESSYAQAAADINLAGLAKPVLRIINDDKTCAGVVREDGNADGECPSEAANLPTISYKKVFNLTTS